MKKAFTLVELIFVILIIGILSAVAIPKFSGLSDNAKIAAELATASSVQTALDACYGEWIINEGEFTCGFDISSTELNSTTGYPTTLGNNSTKALNKILKNADGIGWTLSDGKYTGPASSNEKGVPTSKCKPNKPCIGHYWEYDQEKGTFTLKGE